jgi:glycosyltransferase involved in cell wall biosynthesis
MRVCLIYDCHWPTTRGGAERWYDELASALAAAGHDVTFLTRRQWPPAEQPPTPYAMRGVGFSQGLYTASGRRRIVPPVAFGLAVGRHLRRHGRDYDVVHTAAFPYFPLLAASAARRRGGFRLIVDWEEVWPPEYWRSYLGRVGGAAGAWVQRRCARAEHTAFTFSRLHAGRLRDIGVTAKVLRGRRAGLAPAMSSPPPAAGDRVVFVGRHVPVKNVIAVAPAVARARRSIPGLEAEVFGDGPQRARVLRDITALGLDGAVTAPGFVPDARLEAALGGALCLVAPSSREGYGLVVVEAASRGLPVVLVTGPDNAATELLEPGINGVLAASAAPDDLAAAIVAVRDAGTALRQSTAAWFAHSREGLVIEASLPAILAAYGAPESS